MFDQMNAALVSIRNAKSFVFWWLIMLIYCKGRGLGPMIVHCKNIVGLTNN